MPETARPVTELASQYVSQVTKDLEHNVHEQERVTAEIASLQERLAALQHDHAILQNMQQALGIAASAGGAVVPAPRQKSGDARRPDAKKPATRKPAAKKPATAKAATAKTTAGKTTAGKTTAAKTTAGNTTAAKTTDAKTTAGNTAAAKTTAAKTADAKTTAAKTADAKATAGNTADAKASAEPAQPTLVELVRRYLAEQNEPRSAAEVAEALGRAHPERAVQTKVVRTTLENLVARNGAHRSKQGSSVFYTVVTEPARETPGDAEGTEPAQ
ncbi:hypothetical protein [Streptomyces sp. SCL15-4]|uniref:hypothetical protein n=1 Tax=Streptomyces sp. SCL15-4 TaxID=2967221 RepID=UPI002966D569|nr:hypothetical protein [Streptomyces sp. SCL15-4]